MVRGFLCSDINTLQMYIMEWVNTRFGQLALMMSAAHAKCVHLAASSICLMHSHIFIHTYTIYIIYNMFYTYFRRVHFA